MRVLLVNDIHLSDRPPSSCTEEYAEDLLDLLAQTVTEAESWGVGVVVWTGDVFHSKSPARNSHRLVQRAIGVVRAYRRPVYIVPGNHDMLHDDLGSILDTQPLGVLYQAGARPLAGWANDPDLPIYGVPWQQTWDVATVDRVFKSYRDDWMNRGPGLRLVCAHAPLYPPGHELPYEYYPAEQWAQSMRGMSMPACCAYGHVHERHGVWECGGVRFCNPGALSRGSLHEYNMTRPVQVAVWDSDDGSFTEVALHARPAEQVFRLREKRQLTDTAGKLDDFLAQVGGASVEVLSVEAVLEHVRSLRLGREVEEEVSELLDWAAHQ